MKTSDCVASNCKYLRHSGRGPYRCVHPGLSPKKTHKHVDGRQIGGLKECPNEADNLSLIELFGKRYKRRSV